MSRVIFFDIDGTMVEGQTQVMLARYLFHHKMVDTFFILRVLIWFLGFKLGLVRSVESIMNRSFSFFKGSQMGEMNQIIDDFFHRDVVCKLYPEAISIIREYKASGDYIFLLSNTIQPIVDLLVVYLKLSGGVGTGLSTNNGIYAGAIKGKAVYGVEKVRRATELIKDNRLDGLDVVVYSDHNSDYPILEFSDYPHVVNPDKKIKKVARKNNWPILYFSL